MLNAGTRQAFVRSLVRMARRNNATDPEQWLEDQIAAQWTPTSTGGQLISASDQGKTASFAIPEGMSSLELMAALESAIQTLRGGGRLAYAKTTFRAPTGV